MVVLWTTGASAAAVDAMIQKRAGGEATAGVNMPQGTALGVGQVEQISFIHFSVFLAIGGRRCPLVGNRPDGRPRYLRVACDRYFRLNTLCKMSRLPAFRSRFSGFRLSPFAIPLMFVFSRAIRLEQPSSGHSVGARMTR